MANKSDVVRRRISGLRLNTNQLNTRIRHGFLSKPWPQLANKLDSLGWLESISITNGEVLIDSVADPNLISQVIAGHRTKSKIHKPMVLSIAVVVLIVLSLIPLGKSPKVVPKQVASAKLSPCSDSLIEQWLEGHLIKGSPIKALDTSILGGVTAGIVECKGARYSYTLGSKEPKRVLNLRKLDS